MKFGRTYALTIQVADARITPAVTVFTQGLNLVEDLIISYPITLEFDVQRNVFATSNTGHLRIRNLAPDTRRQIFHDRNQTLIFRRVILQAGYEDESPLPTIFQGNITSAYSYRQGIDWVTEIEAFDGGFGTMNGQVSQTVPKGWNLKDILLAVMGTLPNIAQGAIGNVETGSSRGITLQGNSWDMIQNLTSSQNAMCFVDNEKANVLLPGEYIDTANAIPLITSETGLLETPRRYDNRVDLNILFEPRLHVGQVVQVQSLEQVYNAQYVVLGVHHSGTISGAVCGDVRTVASLNLGPFQLKAVAASK